jgi:hypothetical protein
MTGLTGGGGGDLLAANNLSDLANAATARTNLGVAIGSDVQAHSSVLDGTTASFTTAKDSKLTGIEASADVTDTTNVTAAGALMDSEVTNLAQVKAFDSSDYATAAQGTTADAALPRTGGAMTGAITTNSTFDGRDVGVDGAKLDGIEDGANVTDAANVEPLVDAHLNTSTAASSEVLSWTGTDYDWVAQSGGGGASTEIAILAKTASYTVVAGDAGKIISFSGGAYTATLTAAATLGSGFFCYIENNAATSQATHTVTIDPNASETIDGRTTFIVRQGERVQLVCDGSNFKLISSFHRGIATNMRTDFFNLPQALGQESIAIGLGTIAGVGNTSNSTAIGTNAQAGSAALALGSSTNAGSSNSTALGKNSGGGGSVTATGSGAMALGGSYASGTNSFAAAIANNTSSYGATGANSIAMGNQAKASSSRGVAIGAYALSSSTSIALSTGWNNIAVTASGSNSVAIGGGTSATSPGSYAFGQQSSSAIRGKYAYAAGRFAANGDAQGGQFILRADTTDATATVLTTNNSTAAADNQIVALSDTCITFDGTITAMQNGAQSYASWRIEGLLVNDGGTTTVANSAITVIDNQSNWGLSLTADNTNNALAITFTGEAAHNIRTVANIRTSEVTYA